ncbi:hypothetical protein [Parasphingopyxis sp.]|uniref:hypothetical protein n=1 Tax=Parasphingopyxis sp. TaxID=1920299 RepID=UPI00262F2F37|nr:hypothetical protein [Parasphingopyxis sp.]
MTDTDKLLTEPADKAPLTNPSGGADMTSPVDLPESEEEERNPLLWTSIAIAVATGVLMLFNADALRGWAFELEPGPQSERIVAITDGWYRQTERFYLDRPVAAMSEWWDGIKAIEFGSDDQRGDTVEPGGQTSESEGADSPGFSPE